MSKKNLDVYDNVKYLTPMKKMLLEQEAKRKLLEEKEEENGNSKSTNRKSRTNTGTDK